MTSIQLNIGDRLNKSLIKTPEYKISYDQATTIDDFLVKIQKQTDNKINQIILNFLYIREWIDGEFSGEDLLNKDVNTKSL